MSIRPTLVALLSWLLLVTVPSTDGADLHVAPTGNDAWSGRLAASNADGSDGPLATLAGARDAIRRLKAKGSLDGAVRVLVAGGAYRVSEPIVFTPQDSGTKDAPIVYAAVPGQRPRISGGVPITGWKRVDGELWATYVPAVKNGKWYFRQLFVNDQRCIPARTPNDDVFRSAGPGVPYKDRAKARRDPKTKTSFFYQDDDLKAWPNMGDAVAVVYHSWTTSRHRIKSLDTKKRLVEFTAPSSWPMSYWEKNERYYVESVREALDASGEWYLDRKSGLLTYYPRPGEDMTKATVVAPMPEEILRLDGDPATGKPIQYLTFEGITFEYTDWIMPEAEPVDGQANASLKTATVHFRGAQNCTLRRCEIARTGGYALWLQCGSKDVRVEQCHIHDMAAGGVRIGETTLPKEEPLQTERNTVSNCFIHNGGNVYHAGIGVWIGRSSYNTVHNNEICDFFYSGVSVGWSWGYAPSTAHHNLIEYNHIHHLGWNQLSDLGGIYCLGLSPGTRLCYNHIHDVCSYSYGGWGLYTDEGSTGILMENNIVYRVKDGAFHQHYGRDNIVQNNVLALSATYGQIRRSRQEEHNSFTARRNIIYSNDAPTLGGNWSNGNFKLESNCYWDASGKPPAFPGGLTLAQWQAKGHDAGSIVADPKFVDAANFNFGVRRDSPVLKLGFKPIDTDKIGLIGSADWKSLPDKVERPAFKLPGEE